MKIALRTRMVGQFGKPRGLPGRLAIWTMTHRSSNRRRARWAVSLLDVRPADRVLEIGFGPGLAIAALAARADRGTVYGIDHSEVAVRRAARRNRAAIRAGRVDLRRAPVERLPDFGAPLDTILAINTVKFWPDPPARLRELRGALRPGGRIALVNQPRCPGANADTTAAAAAELRDWLSQAGFDGFRTEILALDPPVACVLAVNPADKS